MFSSDVYSARRRTLLAKMAACDQKGIAIFLGNADAPMNYRGNDYKFRQESSFWYYWGIDEPNFAAIIDLESGQECLYGNDVDIDDIIWMGPQPSVASKAALTGCAASAPLAAFEQAVAKAVALGRPVHHLPTSRYHNELRILRLLGSVTPSLALTKAVISMRLIKEECEIQEIDKACIIGYLMHTEARKGCKIGTPEQEIVGRMEGITISKGWGVSFATILSQHGETLHNHNHFDTITDGRLLLVDAGAESNEHYASDFTRTYPTSGRFTTKQREIYDIVESCNALAFELARPGVTYRSVHLAVVENMLNGLKSLGIVNGDVPEMVANGLGGLFMPHGLGHNMGIDVHDMEDLNENLVGYDEDQTRANQLGLGSLRMARKLCPGHVITDEPGIYFIPALIEQWKKDGAMKECVNFGLLEKEYYNFGGIRLEDDLLITADGCRHLGPYRLPIKSADVEQAMLND